MHALTRRSLICAPSLLVLTGCDRPGDGGGESGGIPMLVTKTSFSRTAVMLARALLALCIPVLLSGCHDSAGLPDGYAKGETVEIRHGSGASEYRALVYIPAGYRPEKPLPVVINIHGCVITPELLQAGSLFDRVAQREQFIVVYPSFVDQDTHPLKCWRFYLPNEWTRGQGDAAGVVELTRMVMERWSVDPERVYLMGSSSGAFLASVLGATFPDLYAAMVNLAGGPYASTFLDAANPTIPALENPALQAQLAFLAMGSHARVVPLLEIHGDADTTIYPQNGANAVQQWLMTNNLVASGSRTGPFPLAPSQTRAYEQDGDFPYEIDDYRDEQGCLLVRHIRIHGMNHLYPGGSDDPELPPFVEPRAMSASEAAWDFFKRYRKSGTSLPCVEGP